MELGKWWSGGRWGSAEECPRGERRRNWEGVGKGANVCAFDAVTVNYRLCHQGAGFSAGGSLKGKKRWGLGKHTHTHTYTYKETHTEQRRKELLDGVSLASIAPQQKHWRRRKRGKGRGEGGRKAQTWTYIHTLRRRQHAASRRIAHQCLVQYNNAVRQQLQQRRRQRRRWQWR